MKLVGMCLGLPLVAALGALVVVGCDRRCQILEEQAARIRARYTECNGNYGLGCGGDSDGSCDTLTHYCHRDGDFLGAPLYECLAKPCNDEEAAALECQATCLESISCEALRGEDPDGYLLYAQCLLDCDETSGP